MGGLTTHISLPSWAQEELENVKRHVDEALPPVVKAFLEAIGYRIPDHESDLLRPYLLLLVARHNGSLGNRAVRLAAGLQMIHLASLLHDRLGDSSAALISEFESQGERHQWEALDILLGDMFFSRASSIFVEDGVEKIIEDMIRTSLASAEAQATIVSLDERPDTKMPFRSFEARADKLSLLLSLGLRVGAVLGGSPSEEEQILSDYGYSLGRALRILQDLEFWRVIPEEKLQKVPWEVKYGYPMLLLWEKKGLNVWEKEVGQIGPPVRDSMLALRSRLHDEGLMAASVRKGLALGGEAADRVSGLVDSKGLSHLDEIARHALFREWKNEEEVTP